MSQKKLEIRTINDFQGNTYRIYDIQVKGKFGLWKSVHTAETFEEALKWNCEHMEDLSEE